MSLIDHSFASELTDLLNNTQVPQELTSQDITSKAKFDYVTKFDLQLDKSLRDFIQKKFPQHKTVSEEDKPSMINFDGPTWILDPLDGTSNFISGIPFFCSTLAFVDKGKVSFGFVYDFHRKETFYAFNGKGFYCDGKKVSSKTSHTRKELISLSSGTIDYCLQRDPQRLAQIRKQGRIRILGSQALALAYVAAGRLTANVNYEAKIWDDIAGTLLLKESGFMYKSFEGFDPNEILQWKSSKNLFSLACSKEKKDNLLNLFSQGKERDDKGSCHDSCKDGKPKA